MDLDDLTMSLGCSYDVPRMISDTLRCSHIGHIPQGDEMSKMCPFFFKLYCDQIVLLFQVFSTVLKRF